MKGNCFIQYCVGFCCPSAWISHRYTAGTFLSSSAIRMKIWNFFHKVVTVFGIPVGIVFIAWQLPLLLKSVNTEFIQNKIFLQIDWENDLINIYQNLLYIRHCVVMCLVLFSWSVMSDSLWLHGLQHARLPCPSPSPGVCSNSCPLSDAIQPSNPLLSSSPAFSFSQHQGLFKWVSSSHHVAKVLEFQLQHQSFQWIFRTDFL